MNVIESEKRIEEQICGYNIATAKKTDLLKTKWNVEDEVDAIKRQVEADCADPDSPSFVSAKTDIPKQTKRVRANHVRYQVACQELHLVDVDLITTDAEIESSRMRAWSGIAALQSRSLKPSEAHNHPVDS